jgi:hypothetical protein
VVALALFFAVSAVLVEQRMLPWGRGVRAVVSLQEAIRPLAPAAISYERAGLETFGFNGYQFWLDRVAFHLFDAAAGERPRDPLVVASKRWGTKASGYRLIGAEPGMDQALWVAPGPLQTDLDRRGWLVPTDPATPLPPEACRSHLGRLDGEGPLTLRAGATVPLRFSVEHAGSRAPWLPIGATPTPWGSIRLGGQWYRSGETAPLPSIPLRAELPRMLRPGDAVEIRLETVALQNDGTPLPAGRYDLDVALVQEGIQWFPAAGDAALRIPVEIR